MFIPRRVPIPPAFFADETGTPFTHCLDCERPLQAPGVHYLIEKAVRHVAAYGARDTIFEYALCFDCYEQIYTAFSGESRRRIERYFEERVDFAARAEGLQDEAQIEAWFEACMVDGTPREALSEYQLLAHCMGDQLVLTHLPCLLGGPALDEVATLLSNATLDEMNGFRSRFFDLPPGLKRTPHGPDVLFI